MKRWMLALLTFGSATLLQAAGCGTCNTGPQNYCNNACQPICCGSFEVGAELLYLRPSVCDLNYAIIDDRPYLPGSTGTAAQLPSGKARAINLDYQWGFRALAAYVFDSGCSDVVVEYTGLHASRADSFAIDELGGYWITYGQPRYISQKLFNGIGTDLPNQLAATAHARAKYDYDAVELQLGSRSMQTCNLKVRGFLSLHWANIDHRFEAHYEGTANPGQDGQKPLARTEVVNINARRCTWGVGPKLGIDARYDISCGFGLGARAAFGVIVGDADGSIHQNVVTRIPTADNAQDSVATQLLDVRYPNRAILIPVINVRLGINYTWCCNDCFTVITEIGYEFISYINAVGETVYNDNGSTQSQQCYSFNLDGLYLMGRIMF